MSQQFLHPTVERINRIQRTFNWDYWNQPLILFRLSRTECINEYKQTEQSCNWQYPSDRGYDYWNQTLNTAQTLNTPQTIMKYDTLECNDFIGRSLRI